VKTIAAVKDMESTDFRYAKSTIPTLMDPAFEFYVTVNGTESTDFRFKLTAKQTTISTVLYNELQKNQKIWHDEKDVTKRVLTLDLSKYCLNTHDIKLVLPFVIAYLRHYNGTENEPIAKSLQHPDFSSCVGGDEWVTRLFTLSEASGTWKTYVKTKLAKPYNASTMLYEKKKNKIESIISNLFFFKLQIQVMYHRMLCGTSNVRYWKNT
jgi:hypothetical protein